MSWVHAKAAGLTNITLKREKSPGRKSQSENLVLAEECKCLSKTSTATIDRHRKGICLKKTYLLMRAAVGSSRATQIQRLVLSTAPHGNGHASAAE